MFSADNLLKNFETEERKEEEEEEEIFFSLFLYFSFFSLPLLAHLIKWTECCDLLYLSPTGCSSYLKKKKTLEKSVWMHSYARLYEDQKKNEKEWTITDAGNTQHFANHKN